MRPAPWLPDSPYRKYVGTGLGPKLRMHPLAAVLILKQLEGLDQRNAMIRRQVRQLNDRICQLPGLSEPVCRKDIERVYYHANVLFLDSAKVGISRETLVKATSGRGRGGLGVRIPREPQLRDLLGAAVVASRAGRTQEPARWPRSKLSGVHRDLVPPGGPRTGRAIRQGVRKGLRRTGRSWPRPSAPTALK